MIRRPPGSPPFPYTTLFRSSSAPRTGSHLRSHSSSICSSRSLNSSGGVMEIGSSRCSSCRSEEHTSELQSHLNLVFRLLLQKKKKSTPHTIVPSPLPTPLIH